MFDQPISTGLNHTIVNGYGGWGVQNVTINKNSILFVSTGDAGVSQKALEDFKDRIRQKFGFCPIIIMGPSVSAQVMDVFPDFTFPSSTEGTPAT